MKREFDPQIPELMDRPQPVTREFEFEIENLIALNRRFGGRRITRRFLDGWLSPGRCYRVLDLCTGCGDIPRFMLDWAREREIVLRLDAVDANASTIEIARKKSAGYSEINFIHADVRTFESDATYDLVCCSLALHHFSEDDAVALLQRCRDFSHRFVLVTDLERSLATSLGVWALTTFLYREPMIRFDGRLSARRAFSFHEFRTLAETAGWRDFGHARYLPCRQALWLDTRDPADVPEVAIETLPSLA